MTTPQERTRAIVHTAEFLRDRTILSATPDVPQAVREEARRLLRHYPGQADMRLAHTVMPHWYGELPQAQPYPHQTACGRPVPQTRDAQGAFEDEAIYQAIREQAELLPVALRDLEEVSPPGSLARGELVARLQQLRSLLSAARSAGKDSA